MRKRHVRIILLIALLSAPALALAVPPPQYSDVGWKLDLSGKGKFFDLPFPSELRRNGDGTIDMDGFPNVLGLKMISRTKDAVSEGYGFSPGGTIYFRFDGGVDESNFPDPDLSRREVSTLFLMDVDPDSPERGRLFPLTAHFYKKAPKLMRGNGNLLAIMPVPGFVLRTDTLYAAGVLTSLGAKKGGFLMPAKELADIANGNVPEGALGRKMFDAYGPALSELASHGVNPEDMAALAVFRVGDPTERTRMLYDGVREMPVIKFTKPLEKTREYDLYYVLEGVVSMPQFQDGTPPYGHGKGGRIHFDENGKPIVQRMEDVPVAFSIPKGRMPDKGWPITIFIHGTAGVSTQFIDRGEIMGDGPPATGLIKSNFGDHGEAEPGTGPALIYARHGIAGVGAAQQHAGERGGLDAQIFYYNFLSPEALRDNMLQATAEASMLLMLVKDVQIDPALCPETGTGGAPVSFDPELIFGMGQSLGSLIMGSWGAVEKDLKVLIPSGNGAYWSIFMAVGNPLDMKMVKRSGKGLTQMFGLDVYHPVINMLCTVLAEGDPMAWQRYYLREPLPGREPKNVWASFGLYDHYFSPMSQNAAIIIMGLDFAGPVLEPSTAEALRFAGLEDLDYPVQGNKQTEEGPVTAAAVQYEQKGPLDGHHVNYQRDDAKYQYGCFLESAVKDGVPTVYKPKSEWDAECGP